ncbi:crotonobetainyl-CoA:carnitine CoA-transferase CaiB-like acyl-CoA transferase [Melghirimyces profundicolus]|uniref:Crotonobetainyl-CoA:carnitine CoA-transferase CaiB-like acyl-CoA transferase n=1 Tax=Melghirimyces profundicolus TaxID=1242148 RepID=A0A2T6BG03_9BACL|nr:CaiB/BaiF CoA-transferase family protein [Melghirimyces profundicolus]PTX54989.1 crotonobetainyl-CoA:carnitine CoA-transferase CaiB-like acyl-CoA transferase [Melghirimyces profundicolus]
MQRQTLLKGMRVLDFSRYLPGPYATLRLGDMGADVVKVEDPEGGGDLLRHLQSPGSESGLLFRMLNRNKRSLAVRFRKPEGRELLHQLIEDIDVVVESYRPGVMARWGLDAETLRGINPRLIYCSITGYGQEGRMANLAGHDVNYIGLAGILDGVGRRDGPPALPSIQVADLAGGLAASEQILAAWIHRQNTGEGAFLDLSMMDVLYGWQAYALFLEQTGQAPSRGAHVLGGGVVGYNVYETGDGKYMALGALEPKFWDRFCEAVGRLEWKGRGLTPVSSDKSLYADIQALFRSKSREEWTRIGEEADCCLTPVLSVTEAIDSPLAVDRNGFITESQEGSSVSLPNGGTLKQGAVSDITPAPRLGEHTKMLLIEAGYSPEEIGRLQKNRVIEGGGSPP